MELYELGSRLSALNHLRRNRIRKKTANCDLHPMQLPILEAIKETPGCSQQDAAKALGVTAASIALSTKRLEKSGCIEKKVDPGNRRSNQLFATQRGREVTILFRRAFDETDTDTFAGFTEAEQVQLVAYLDRMIQNLSGQDELPRPPQKGGSVC